MLELLACKSDYLQSFTIMNKHTHTHLFSVLFKYIILCSTSYYEGDVLDGLRHGHGVYHSAGGQVSYTGIWDGGKRHGKVCEKKFNNTF